MASRWMLTLSLLSEGTVLPETENFPMETER